MKLIRYGTICAQFWLRNAKAIKSGRGKIRSVMPCAVFGNDSDSASSPDNIQKLE